MCVYKIEEIAERVRPVAERFGELYQLDGIPTKERFFDKLKM